MKILLISANTAEDPYPVYPLGMGIVANILARRGHEIVQYDFLASGKSLDTLTDALRSHRPELVGISIRNIDNVNVLSEQHYIASVRQIVDTVRAASSAPVLLGGAGFSIMPEVILAAVGADYGIVGEAESSVADFVAAIERGEVPPKIMRAARLVEPGNMLGARYAPEIVKNYLSQGTTLGVQTKRGCVHHCVYCPYPLLEGRSFRPRPVRDVADDIERLINDYQAPYVFFTDSVFNDDDGNYLQLLEEMRRRRLSIPWTGYIKPGPMREEHVLLMKETGLDAAEIGSDAASDAALRGLGKEFTFSDVIATNELFTRHGIATAHFFMFGGPGETEASVNEGIANVIALKKTVSFMFMGVRILPGTPLEKIALQDGVIKPGQSLLESAYYFSPALDRNWLEKVLTEGFKDHRCCVFPANQFDAAAKFLRQMGHAGSLWKLLSRDKIRNRRHPDKG